jgi:adenosylcobinamide-phosphate synthase
MLALALLADLTTGDPAWFKNFHPVSLIGRLVSLVEPVLRGLLPARIAGAVLAVIIPAGVYSGAYYFQACIISYPWGWIAIALVLSTLIALRGLISEGRKILGLVNLNDLTGARRGLRSLCGRDPDGLDEAGLRRAVIESLAENASDGVIAPIFYFVLGGLPLAFAYKAVNTLDSMVGYRNEKYMEFGWASARLDDAANFIPARLTGIFISTAALLFGKGTGAFRTMLRDGRNHPSPNSGVPMAAMAGALGITLGGKTVYGGKFVEKPLIGSGGDNALSGKSASEAVKFTFAGSLLGAAILVLAALLAGNFLAGKPA